MRATSAPARLRRALDRAERQFVARVVADRGIGSWRVDTHQCLARALDVFSRCGRLSRQAAADLVVALVDKPVRDCCWRLVESRVDVDWQTFWVHVSRRALSPYRAEPLFLLAWSAWRLGDVQLARSAADAALAQDPGHHAAAMLLLLLSLYVEPGGPPSLGSRPGTSAAAL